MHHAAAPSPGGSTTRVLEIPGAAAMGARACTNCGCDAAFALALQPHREKGSAIQFPVHGPDLAKAARTEKYE
jgi:hypothetical protein